MPDHEVIALNHRFLSVAQSILAVQLQSYACEALLLGAKHFPPLDAVVQDIQNSNETFIGSYYHEELIGAASYIHRINNRETEIGSLVVHPAWHRRKVGTKLLGEILRGNSGLTIVVATGLKNDPAISLYSRYGFIEYANEAESSEPIQIIRLRKSAA